jgi:hypothetical protein
MRFHVGPFYLFRCTSQRQNIERSGVESEAETRLLLAHEELRARIYDATAYTDTQILALGHPVTAGGGKRLAALAGPSRFD